MLQLPVGRNGRGVPSQAVTASTDFNSCSWSCVTPLVFRTRAKVSLVMNACRHRGQGGVDVGYSRSVFPTRRPISRCSQPPQLPRMIAIRQLCASARISAYQQHLHRTNSPRECELQLLAATMTHSLGCCGEACVRPPAGLHQAHPHQTPVPRHGWC